MAHLIIGHASDTSVRLWVRGSATLMSCTLTLRPPPLDSRSDPRHVVSLYARTDFTATVDFKNLEPGTDYTVTAMFASATTSQEVGGRFRTAPRRDDVPAPFSFVLSSCNLSVVSINNFLALLLAMGGSLAAKTSLDLPFERWTAYRFIWLRRLIKLLAQLGLFVASKVIRNGTGGKQPGPPYLRSPFLKINAVFSAWVLRLDNVQRNPRVGDVVHAAGGQGVVAASIEETDDSRPGNHHWQLVVTEVDGSFSPSTLMSDDTPIGCITAAAPAHPWYWRPAFFLHAGDQIYYDFPKQTRAPDRAEYRLNYVEAWFDDHANRHVLTQWPHYMVLDDHEIADQFARDFTPPTSDVPDAYFAEAMTAYREYVHSRNPRPSTGVEPGQHGPFWYNFEHGKARFFVLDTRTQRRNDDGQIVDEDQLDRLLAWMKDYPSDLKFVVTSVPFVAEINVRENTKSPKWHQGKAGAEGNSDRPKTTPAEEREPSKLNAEHDKWSAPRFHRQRSRIIEHIASHDIEHLVFLTGDMHCCYHAVMRIGDGLKYERNTVHELAGGPVNQLQLPNAEEFRAYHAGESVPQRVPYEVILDSFHSQVSAVMHVRVNYVARHQARGPSPIVVPEVDWSVIRTVTDVGSKAWSFRDPTAPPRPGESTMRGRISFVPRRKPEELRRCR